MSTSTKRSHERALGDAVIIHERVPDEREYFKLCGMKWIVPEARR